MPNYSNMSSHSSYSAQGKHNSGNSSEHHSSQQIPHFQEIFGENSMHNNASNSKLEPTAQEFYPASYNYGPNSSESISKRQQGNNCHDRNHRYGSGRLTNSNTFDNKFDYQQMGYADHKESYFTQSQSAHSQSSTNNLSNGEHHTNQTSYEEGSSSSQSAQSSRQKSVNSREKTTFHSKAYSKNRYENQTNPRNKSIRHDMYKKNSPKNVDKVEHLNQQETNYLHEDSRNRRMEIQPLSLNRSSFKERNIDSNSSKDVSNELGEVLYHENYGRGKSYFNNKNKTTNKSRNNCYNGSSSSHLDAEETFETNFDYDSFPSSMRYQGYKNGKSKNNSTRSLHDNLYRNRDSAFDRGRDSSSRGSSRANSDDWNSNLYSGSSNYKGGRGKPFATWKNKPKYISEKEAKKTLAAGQRERLIDMIDRRTLECLVCCEKIKTNDKVWSCMQCYHILHLMCISAWAKSSKVEENWRCPACQNLCSEPPNRYRCYCGKMTDPKFDPNVIPHGCGEMCLKKGRNCEHKCVILCHPGPCPDCNIMVSKSCGCGKTSQTVKCSTDLEIVCDAVCNKILECGIHECMEKCHVGPCSPCSEVIIQECYCGKTGRKVPCTSEYSGTTSFCCENPCQTLLSCGNHRCEKQCHPGDCGPCIKDISIISSCYCGKMPLQEIRTSCLDPIPCCDKICGKVLPCGQPSRPHTCQEKCHEGKCPPCPLTTVVRCRCGQMDKEMACHKLTTKADDARCEKKCNKKRLCGKHKCNQRCCIEIEHFCPLPCNHMLSCGLHRCERTCHSGRCPPCLESSFEELHCECGASVTYPPVPCGTRPPSCRQPCSRTRPCGHPPNHDCHSGPCPSCFVLTKRWCYGHHEQRAAIPCHQENFSCGLPCGKPMPCGRHKCTKPCHEGECPRPCIQPCTVSRMLCGHPCGKPCHDPPCPESYCKQMVSISCLCGLQKGSKPCTEVADEYRNIEMAQLKEKLESMSMSDQAVDISDIVAKPKRPAILKIMECNDECKTLERNRRLAIGLQIRNPDLSQKLTPRYSDFMKQWARKDPQFCQKVHEKLTELVQLAKQSKQKSRSHSFESMNRDKRHFIHEYAEHFGCESAAYDQEPNRNVVATAAKEKSWLPSFSLLEVIQRENGHRKVPGPILANSSTSKPETVSLKVTNRAQKHSTEKVDENMFRNPWALKPAADNEENDRHFNNL